MAILSLKMEKPGNVAVQPRLGQMQTNDLSASVTAAGYLNSFINASPQPISAGDFINAVNSDASHIYTVGISAGSYTLTQVV